MVNGYIMIDEASEIYLMSFETLKFSTQSKARSRLGARLSMNSMKDQPNKRNFDKTFHQSDMVIANFCLSNSKFHEVWIILGRNSGKVSQIFLRRFQYVCNKQFLFLHENLNFVILSIYPTACYSHLILPKYMRSNISTEIALCLITISVIKPRISVFSRTYAILQKSIDI